jgi:hypothetical protein
MIESSSVNKRWNPPVSERAWKAPASRSRAEAVQEQDQAAGGESRRQVQLTDGSVRNASIELKNVQSRRRIYAYLRYSVKGRTVNLYVGQVTQSSRFGNLTQAWTLAHEQNLLAPAVAANN